MIEISIIINKYIGNNMWKEAEKLLKFEITNYSKEYWLYTTLSQILYEQRKYENALKFSKIAMEIEPNDYLVINNHACILSVIDGKEKEAINMMEKIVNTKLILIVEGEYSDGKKWAKSMINDNRVRLALLYISIGEIKLGINYLKDHLNHRERGLFSNFKKREIIQRLRLISKSPKLE